MTRTRLLLPTLVFAGLLGACSGGSTGAPISPPGAPALQSQARSASCLTSACLYISGEILRKEKRGMPQGRGRILDVYRTRPNGNQTEVQAIRGNGNDLGLSGVAVDAARNVYVASGSRIDVFAAGSNGNAAPSRTIRGPKTGLDVQGIAVDSISNIYVVNRTSSSTSVTVYAAGSGGNVKPSRTISGLSTGLDDPNGIAVDTDNDIYVVNGNGSITVYAAGVQGNVAPIRTIAGSNTGLSGPSSYGIYPQGIAVDANDAVYTTVTCGGSTCPDARPNHVGEILASGSNGNIPPIEVGEILTFAPDSDGNVAPIRKVYGDKTGLGPFGHIALDARANIYFAYGVPSDDGTCAAISIVAFAAGANGNVAPFLQFAPKRCDPGGIAVR